MLTIMRRTLTILLLAALPISFALGTSAVVAPAADRVEEDWQLVISTPDPSTNSPQITMTMKPGNDTSYPNMIFNVNYQDYPSFTSGGLQMKVWQGNQVAASSSQGSGQLQTNNETITWTQRMSLSGGNLNFKILSGNSTTWSIFGMADTDLAAGASAPASLSSLVDYNPDTSVAKSGVTFASGCVASMTLLQVRYYQGSTLLSTDNIARNVSINR
jgi:hypothetical protein